MKAISTFLLSLFLVIGFSQKSNYCKSVKEHRAHYKSEFLADERAPLKENDLQFLRFYKPKKKFKASDQTWTDKNGIVRFKMG